MTRGYDSNPDWRELRKRRILPVITCKGAPNIKGLGKLCYCRQRRLWQWSYLAHRAHPH
ncbi:hypothetical protein [Streptomyces sp. DT203]|uniref:hypothetical protein n=1 Tax=Streptomyces sp. DT203 TaxID=3393424 RepID=UPI003CF71D77